MGKYRGIVDKHQISNVCAHDQLNDLRTVESSQV